MVVADETGDVILWARDATEAEVAPAVATLAEDMRDAAFCVEDAARVGVGLVVAAAEAAMVSAAEAVVVSAAEAAVVPAAAAVVPAEMQLPLPGKIVNGAEKPMLPWLSRIASVQKVPAGRLTFHVSEVPLVVPRVARGAALDCPPGRTVMMNGGEEPEKFTKRGMHSVALVGVLMDGSPA